MGPSSHRVKDQVHSELLEIGTILPNLTLFDSLGTGQCGEQDFGDGGRGDFVM